MARTDSPLPPAVPDSLGEVMRENALHFGDVAAVSSDARTLTHAELYRRAHRLAAVWRQLGLRRSDRVAVLAMNCVEILEVYAASEVSGIPLVAMNFRLAAGEHRTILQDSTPTAIVFEAQYAAVIDSLRADTPSLRHFICISDAPAWAEDFETLIAGAPPHVDWDDFPPESLNCLLYTSGTTGKPKGCMIGHAGFRRLAQVLGEMISISPSDRALLMMPLFHIGAKAVQLAIHWAGAELFIHRAFDVEAILRTISEKKITVTHMAPTMVQALLDHPDIGAYDLSSLRVIFYSAAAMPEPVLRRGLELLGPVFIQCYAQTEVTGTVLPARFHVLDGDAKDQRRLTSIGFPPRNVHVKIADDNDDELPRETPGEILIKSPAAMLGYWNNSAATAETLRGGWVHTGDIGMMDEDGFVYLVDRKKDVIISGGENIYSREVENALYEHPAIAEAAVIGVPDARWGEAVRAVVALRQGAEVGEPELIAHCQSLIASYKKPRKVIFVATLPKLASGKIDKKILRQLYGVPHDSNPT